MTSKIQQELSAATGVEPKRREDHQDFLKRLTVGVVDLSDAKWEALSKPAQDWYNDAADAQNAKKKEIPDFPDFEDETTEEKPASRRGAVKEETSTVEVTADDVKEGMALTIKTKRGKEASGHVVEVTDSMVAIKQGDGEEVEFNFDRIESMTTLAAPKAGGRRAAAEDDEGPQVGDSVVVTTKRGKEAVGKIVELDEDVLVLNVDGQEVEFDRERVDSIKLAKADKKEAPVAAKSSRRGAKEEEEAADTKPKRASNGEVSIGTRIKELIADDIKASQDDIAKSLKKEGLEFRDNTLKLNYADAHKFLAILKERKLLK